MFYRIATALALLALSALASSAPPYDVEIDITAPLAGATVDSYECFLDGALIGVCVEGANSFPTLLTADVDYTFHVDSINAVGRTSSLPQTINPGDLLPGAATFQIRITVTVP